MNKVGELMRLVRMLIVLIFIIIFYLWVFPKVSNNIFDIDLIFIMIGSLSLLLIDFIDKHNFELMNIDKHGYRFGLLLSLLKLIALPNGIMSNINILIRPFIYGLIISYLFKWIRSELDKNNDSKDTDDFLRRYQMTPTETVVAQLVMKRLPNKEIADQLNVSLSTVKKHIQNIYRKIDVKSRDELIELYGNKGWWKI